MKNIEILDLLSPSQIKAVFLDIDGTIVDRNHEISINTRHAINELVKRNIAVALATGRPYFGATTIIKELSIKSPSLFCAGATIIDPNSETSLFSQAIEPQILVSLIDKVIENGLYCELYTYTDYYINQENPLAEIHAQYLHQHAKIADFTELIKSHEILKVGFTVEQGSAAEVALRKTLAEFDTLQFATAFGASHPHLLWGSATHKKATRENAFKRLTSLMNISPSEVIAFGDGESDIPFLKLAGIGIAMGNSSQAVQEAARVVTKSVDEDGVFHAISRILFS